MALVSACGSAAASPFCKPEEDPFLLLESSLRAVQEILMRRRGLPLRRSWIEQPYGEEEIALLEEEVMPVLQRCKLEAERETQAKARPLQAAGRRQGSGQARCAGP